MNGFAIVTDLLFWPKLQLLHSASTEGHFLLEMLKYV